MPKINWDDPLPPEAQIVELRNIDEAVMLLDKWVIAYRQLERLYRDAEFMVKTSETIAEGYRALYEAVEKRVD